MPESNENPLGQLDEAHRRIEEAMTAQDERVHDPAKAAPPSNWLAELDKRITALELKVGLR